MTEWSKGDSVAMGPFGVAEVLAADSVTVTVQAPNGNVVTVDHDTLAMMAKLAQGARELDDSGEPKRKPWEAGR